jgi:hypothetical protein
MNLRLSDITHLPIEVHKPEAIIATLETAHGYIDVLFNHDGSLWNGQTKDNSPYQAITIDGSTAYANLNVIPKP